MASSSRMASCGPGFGWMDNERGQDPCTVAGWIIMLCENPTSDQPASLVPLASTSSQYLQPQDTSARACTCSWVFYNTLQACNVCQNSPPEDYESFSSSCNQLGEASTIYWQSNVLFSSRTRFPRWSILNPSSWGNGTFNTIEAIEIYQQNLPDVTDSSASQPSLSSSSTNLGAIAGGVVAGVAVLFGVAFTLWFFLCKRHGTIYSHQRWTRKRAVDLDGGIFRDGSREMAQGTVVPFILPPTLLESKDTDTEVVRVEETVSVPIPSVAWKEGHRHVLQVEPQATSNPISINLNTTAFNKGFNRRDRIVPINPNLEEVEVFGTGGLGYGRIDRGQDGDRDRDRDRDRDTVISGSQRAETVLSGTTLRG